jgi:hypothetical protein
MTFDIHQHVFDGDEKAEESKEMNAVPTGKSPSCTGM